MADRLLIYGATGYSGTLLAEAAARAGLDPVLCARRRDAVSALSERLGTEARVAALEDQAALDRALRDVCVVLNAAGPFSRTAQPLINACLRARCHYLDITGEQGSIFGAAERGAQARAAGVMLMPAVGFDVVPSDCLALHVARRALRPRHLRLGLSGLTLLSRGSARSIIEQLNAPVGVMRDGQLDHVQPGSLSWNFDFGLGTTPSIAVSWGDVATAPYSTAIENVTTYFEANASVRMHHALVRSFGWAIPWTGWQRWLESNLWLLPEGPSEAQRKRMSAVIVAEIENEDGSFVRARLRTPEAYTTTTSTALAIARRVLAGDFEPGFETPARVYGPDFVLGIDGVIRQDYS